MQSLLHSHDQVISYGEVFHLLALQRNNLDVLYDVVNNPTEYIKKRIYRPYPDTTRAVGYKMVYQEIGSDNVFLREMNTKDVSVTIKERREAFSRFMRNNFDLETLRQRFSDYLDDLESDRSVKVIHLKRVNKLKSLCSKKMALKSGVWSSRKDESPLEPIHLNYLECLNYFQDTDGLEKKYDSLFRNHQTVEITFEELLSDLDSVQEKLQNFLGLTYDELSSPLKKLNKCTLRETISNYSALKDKFENSPWIKYFED